jgi:Fe-Mn family superoxide dismutase
MPDDEWAVLTRRQALHGLGLGGLGMVIAAATGCRGTTEGEPRMASPGPQTDAFTLPPLPYPSLEPVIDDATLALHHDKHHAGYVKGANAALAALAKARDAGDFALVKHWERELAFHGCGVVLHNLYWTSMRPPGRGGKASAELAKAIAAAFGSQEKMLAQFAAATKAVEASGWGVLAWEPTSSRLVILQAERHQDLTIWGCTPILVCDVWEHAYYLKYKNDRAAYVDAWTKIIDWDAASQRFAAI